MTQNSRYEASISRYFRTPAFPFTVEPKHYGQVDWSKAWLATTADIVDRLLKLLKGSLPVIPLAEVVELALDLFCPRAQAWAYSGNPGYGLFGFGFLVDFDTALTSYMTISTATPTFRWLRRFRPPEFLKVKHWPFFHVIAINQDVGQPKQAWGGRGESKIN